jgi:hypothetical protein
MEYGEFRERVLRQVDEAVEDGVPVLFDAASSTWTRGALRVTLTPASDGRTVVASRAAVDLFRVGNTLGMRQDLDEDGLAECVSIIAAWLNNPKLYTDPGPPPKQPG